MAAITVITAEGRRIQAEDAMDALRQLRAGSLIPERDAWRYMLRVADLASRSTGAIVRSDSPARFLADMAAVGLLEVRGLADPTDLGKADAATGGESADPGSVGRLPDGPAAPSEPAAPESSEA